MLLCSLSTCLLLITLRAVFLDGGLGQKSLDFAQLFVDIGERRRQPVFHVILIHLLVVLISAGPDPLLYRLFSDLGGGLPVFVVLIAAIFLSYVTAADSNVSAMSALSTHGISPETPEAPLWVKVVWGVTVGLVAIILVAASGIDGIRMMSILGGFPALFVICGAALSVGAMAIRGRHDTAPAVTG